MFKKIFPLVALLALAGCGGDDSFAIDGSWREQQLPVGSSTVMTLTAQQSTVTGTGTWAGEAGPSGTLTVTGSVQSPRVSLTLHYDNGSTAAYSATLTDASHMTGTMTVGGQTAPATFVRQ